MTRTLKPCGTPAANLRHRRHGQPIDEPCRQAWGDYQSRRQRRLRAEKRERRRERQAISDAKAVEAATRAIQQREPRVVRLPGRNIRLGAYAGTSVPHGYVGDSNLGTSCMACFGWTDDYRHLGSKLTAGTA